MSYTVGVKRRLLPGFKKYVVKGHDWKDFRFLLNLENGEQIQIPGFRCPAFKVYADFWIHHAQVNDQIRARRVEQVIVPRGTSEHPMINTVELRGAQTSPSPQVQTPVESALEDYPEPKTNISEEARRNAASRVRSIFQSPEFAETPGAN